MSASRAEPVPPHFYGRKEVFLPTGEESARYDREATDQAGVPSPVLMENAGRSAALVLARLFPKGSVVVAVGPGNNGGDGIVLARTLAAQGREVRVLCVGDRPSPDPLLHGWQLAVEAIPESDQELSAVLGESVLVDALLGTGAKGEPREPHARVIRHLNVAGGPVLSLDIPSGVDAGTGAAPGLAVEADVTVAFGAPKLGSLLLPGRALSGRIVAVEIGFPPWGERPPGARLITPDWAAAHRPQRALATHKKAAGWVLILAGSPGMAGAAILAARGALRAGAGYVQVASPHENRLVVQGAVPEALFVDASDVAALEEAAGKCDVLAAGPGMGTGREASERLDRLLGLPGLKGVVLDADALTLLGRGELPRFPGAVPPARRLLTPHPGEMARMGVPAEDIGESPLEACRAGAARWSAPLLLKGTPSVVAEPGNATVWVSGTGSSDLARAGMGDVLTGVAAAFMARGVSASTAAALALHYTGWAASLAGHGESLLPPDVAEALSDALRQAPPEGSDLDLPFVTLDLDPPH